MSETEILPRSFTAIHQLLYERKLGVLCWKIDQKSEHGSAEPFAQGFTGFIQGIS